MLLAVLSSNIRMEIPDHIQNSWLANTLTKMVPPILCRDEDNKDKCHKVTGYWVDFRNRNLKNDLTMYICAL